LELGFCGCPQLERRVRSPSMRKNTLIDLYLPAVCGSPEEVVDAATNVGLDAVIYVCDFPDELPDPDELAELNGRGGCQLYPAFVFMGGGYRAMVIFEETVAESYDILEATGSYAILEATATELGGVVVPVSPHLDVDGEVIREVTVALGQTKVGVVALTSGPSSLARHLDVEDTLVRQVRVLGATGPFGTLDNIGKYATLLPGVDEGATFVVRSLRAGLGVAVEQSSPQEERQRRGRSHGNRGRSRNSSQRDRRPRKRRS
jgi:hypothetical protein